MRKISLPIFFGQFVKYLFLFMMTVILFCNIVLSSSMAYAHRIYFVPKNWFILIVSLVLLLLMVFLVYKSITKLKLSLTDKQYKLLIGLIFIGVALLQFFIIYFIYFKTGWDPDAILSTVNERLVNKPQYYFQSYFSKYPNNVFLLALTTFFAQVGALFSLIPNVSMVIMSAFFVDLAGLLLCLSVKDVTKSKTISLFALGFYIVLLCLSPWIIIPYSDTYSIVFPIAILTLYQFRGYFKRQYVIWFLIAFLTTIGMLIKPTVVIIFIALVLVEIFKISKNNIHKLCKNKNVYLSLVLIICALLTSGVVQSISNQYMHFTPTPQRNFTLTHYAMMGQNNENNGCYYHADVAYSESFDTTKERNKAGLDEAINRITSRSFSGTLNFFAKKLMTNYNDGTFAWGREGEFYILSLMIVIPFSRLYSSHFITIKEVIS